MNACICIILYVLTIIIIITISIIIIFLQNILSNKLNSLDTSYFYILLLVLELVVITSFIKSTPARLPLLLILLLLLLLLNLFSMKAFTNITYFIRNDITIIVYIIDILF